MIKRRSALVIGNMCKLVKTTTTKITTKITNIITNNNNYNNNYYNNNNVVVKVNDPRTAAEFYPILKPVLERG